LIVSGPGGVGKTTLIREFVRRSTAAEFAYWCTPADLGSGRLRRWLRAQPSGEAILICDDVDDEAHAGLAVREFIRNIETAKRPRLIFIGRASTSIKMPHSLRVRVPPLSLVDARDLALNVIDDAELAQSLAQWSAGNPLAVIALANLAFDPRSSSAERYLVYAEQYLTGIGSSDGSISGLLFMSMSLLDAGVLFDEQLCSRLGQIVRQAGWMIELRLFDVIAQICDEQGKVGAAVIPIQLALDLRELNLGPAHIDTIRTRTNLGLALESIGSYDLAISALERALTDAEEFLPGGSDEGLNARCGLAAVYEIAGDSSRAAALAEPLLELDFSSEGDPRGAIRIQGLNVYASALRSLGRTGEATDLFRRIADETAVMLGPTNRTSIEAVNNLAVSLREWGQTEEALQLITGAVAASTRSLGEYHGQTLSLRNNAALCYQALGRVDESIDLLTELVSDCDRSLGEAHRSALAARTNLGTAYRTVGRFDDAISTFEIVVRGISEQGFQPRRELLRIRGEIAETHREAGRLAESILLYNAALQDGDKEFGRRHPAVMNIRSGFGLALDTAGELPRALSELSAVFVDRRAVLGENHPETLVAGQNLARVMQSRGNYGDAVQLFEVVLRSQIELLGKAHIDVLVTMQNLAQTYRSLSRHNDALTLYLEASDLYRSMFDHTSVDSVTCTVNLAGAYAAVHSYDTSLRYYADAQEMCDNMLGPSHPLTLACRNNMATVYQQTGSIERAIVLFEQVVSASENLLGYSHPSSAIARQNLADAYRELDEYYVNGRSAATRRSARTTRF
jgi:tetratricopeptide (TPR) repeat protein